MVVRRLPKEHSWPFRASALVVKPTFRLTTRRTWIDGEKIPAEGGCILVLNHISHVDPLVVAHLLYNHGRLPRYLAKSGLFKNKAMAKFFRAAGQIPVERMSRNAAGAFGAAVDAVNDGECVVVYVEGTLTRDPDLWPMVGKSGAARIALATGAPVIPIGQWGAHELLAPYTKVPHVFPRPHLQLKVGDPVDLSDLVGKEKQTPAINEATTRIMDAIVALVEELRGEKAPPDRFDPRKAGVSEIGNPNKDRRPQPSADDAKDDA